MPAPGLRPVVASSSLAWILACAAAEAIGMTASAAAARTADATIDGPQWWATPGLALAVIVAGGLVEGSALGWAQGSFLRRRLPGLHVARFFLATLLVAGLGWAAASAPAVLSSDSGGSQPPMGLVLLGAVGLGLVMGPVLGGAQALALRGVVRHPGRWVIANTVAWPFVMVVIFLGATTPQASWSTGSVVALGTLTGLAAGAVLGAITWPFIESLSGQAVGNRVFLALLASRWGRWLQDSAVGLEVRGRRTGRSYRFPVHYAELETGELLVVPGHPDRKTWWTNLDHDSAPVRILRGDDWEPAYAALLLPGDVFYSSARQTYERRWPHVRMPADQPLVSIRPAAQGILVPGRVLEHVDC